MMYLNEATGRILQIGVASFLPSFGCGNGYPSGFVRLRYYIDWIYSVTGDIIFTPTSSTSVITTAALISTTEMPTTISSSSTTSQSVDGGTSEFPPDKGGSGSISSSPLIYNSLSAVALVLCILYTSEEIVYISFIL